MPWIPEGTLGIGPCQHPVVLVPTMIMESQGPKGVGQVAKYPAIFWECLALWEDMASPHVPVKGGKWAGRMNPQTSPQKRGDLEPPTRTTNQRETDFCGTLQPFRFLHLLKSVFVSVGCPVLMTTANTCRFVEGTSANGGVDVHFSGGFHVSVYSSKPALSNIGEGVLHKQGTLCH